MAEGSLSMQLYEIMRMSLSDMSAAEMHARLSTLPDVHSAEASEPPASKRLVEAIWFSRWFVRTYYAVLAVAIAVAAFSRLYRTFKRRYQSRRSTVEPSAQSFTRSSSSTTLLNVEDVSTKVTSSEESFLLGKGEKTEPGRQSFVSRCSARLRSFLIFEPKPLPALTASKNSLPSNGTSILVILLLLINAFYLFFNISWSIGMVFAFADRAGACFIVNLPVIYILAAKNTQPLRWLTGWSYEGLNIFHRRLGEWMTFLAVVHSAGMVVVWYTLLRPSGLSLAWFLTRKIITIGVVALVMYLLIFATSTGYFRQRYYELFLILHIFFQCAAVILLFFHHPEARWYCVATISIWIIDRVIGRTLISSTKFVATLQIAPDQETVLLFCDIPIESSKIGDIRSGWKAGQHVFVSVPGIKWYHRYQAHPFTIASPAPPLYLKNGKWPLEIIVRAKDGFSKDLLEYAKLHQHTQIQVDGPYGGTEVLEAIQHADRTCFIAGGSGIAVTNPLCWAAQVSTSTISLISVRTVYENGVKKISNATVASPVARDEHCVHFWIRQQSDHSKWITLFPKQSAHLRSSLQTEELDSSVHAINLVNQSFETRTQGRPDMNVELREWVHSGTAARGEKESKICVVVSGPDSLVREVRNSISTLVREGYNIEVFVEKFGW